MQDLILAIALICVIEGGLYALFPDGMKRAMATVQTVSSGTLRQFGLGFAIFGVFVVWLIRG
jgi:uncharacterized protein YjeT (DUF2065 family)